MHIQHVGRSLSGRLLNGGVGDEAGTCGWTVVEMQGGGGLDENTGLVKKEMSDASAAMLCLGDQEGICLLDICQ